MANGSPEPRYATVEGQRVLIVEDDRGLPRKLNELLAQMSGFGFTYSADPQLGGASDACLRRVHRFVRFREGRWFNTRAFAIHGDHPQAKRIVSPGVLSLALTMCADCGAVCVRDVSVEMWAGARPARLVNRLTGVERTAPAVGQRNVVLGWYSGARRNRREYR
jgi:hypothetical protein